ncbi:leucine-rich repeat-containing G-protein coupled receptor 4 isoform X3 [Ananas comosus]|uniref:Leucine-rich repeat-containing G-protein coupled receptor 4 isoform X3 n=1 Tax=Ananas comosus TaxID=4615 RepID=A0A6P5FTD3_ANACO|nr:leucine-rich repeat-containing G-protein coupled receptor 4 isoform X3 [Ananas comosus]
MCIAAASASAESVERWRRQRRTLDRLPSHLADALLRRLLRRRLLYPSLLEVFQYSVEEVDLKGENSVDAEWLAYLGSFRYLRTLKLVHCRGINNSSIWPISGMSTLKELDLSRCSKITDAAIRNVISIESLEKLYLAETRVTANGVMLLSSLKNLCLLDLGGIPVTNEALSSLQVLTRIEYLDVWGSSVTNAGAAKLTAFPRLNFLNLAWTNVTVLPYLPSLRVLNMSNCTVHSIFDGDHRTSIPLTKFLVSGSTLTDIDESFSYIEASSLTFLDMSGCSVSNFSFLEKLKRLEHLDLRSTKIVDNTIELVANIGVSLRDLNLSHANLTSYGVSALAGAVMNIESLSLGHTGIDDSALSYIGTMPSLRTVDLSHTHIKGFIYWGRDNRERTLSLCALQNLKHLENLNLDDTQLKDEVVQPLSSLKELNSLYLKSDYLSDITLHAVSSLSNLKVLGFRGTVLSNSGLLLYMPPPTLEVLDLRLCWLLTEDAVLAFCRGHPQIEVRHELVEKVNAERGGSVASSHLNKMTQIRSKGMNFPQVARGNTTANFVDERVKYSMEELMELKHLPVSSSSLHGTQIPPELRRTELFLQAFPGGTK